MKKYNYIYLITNNLNGKLYVGKHSTDKPDDGYMGSGKIIKQAVKKEGIENFTKEIIAYADTEETLNWMEKFYIKKFHTRAEFGGYNLTDGGDGTINIIVSVETKKKISYAKKGKPSWNKGLKNVQEAWNKGKQHSEESKKKMSEAHKGNAISDEAKQKISNALKGKPTWNKGGGHPLKKYKWLTSDGEIKEMNKQSVHLYHPDWTLLNEN